MKQAKSKLAVLDGYDYTGLESQVAQQVRCGQFGVWLRAEQLGLRLTIVLERYRKRMSPEGVSELAQHLREFAEKLEKQ
jgi:hypothetical protein